MSGAKLPGIEKLREHREHADRRRDTEPEAASAGRPEREATNPDEPPRDTGGQPARVSAGPPAARGTPTGAGADEGHVRRHAGRRRPVVAVPSGTGVHLHARVSLDLLDELERRLDSLSLTEHTDRLSKRNMLAVLVDDLCREERADELHRLLTGYRSSDETRSNGRHRVSTEVSPTVHHALRASLRRPPTRAAPAAANTTRGAVRIDLARRAGIDARAAW